MAKGGRAGRTRVQALADLQQAGRLLDQGQHAAALPLLERAAPAVSLPAVHAALGDCLGALGRADDALEAYTRGARAFPGDPELALRLAAVQADRGLYPQALPHFRVAARAHRTEASFLGAFAYAALQVSAWAEAEAQAAAALAIAESQDARLVLGLAQAGQGHLAEAAATFDTDAASPRIRALAARFHVAGGDLQRALALHRALEAEGELRGEDWALAAQAAAFAGEGARARALLDRAEREHPGVETRLASAQVALLRGEPGRAVSALDDLESLPALDPADRALALVLRARALRLLEQGEASAAALDAIPAGAPPRVRVLAAIERGHLQAGAGEFEAAGRAFEEALRLDPAAADAQRGLALAQQKLSWKREVLGDAERRVEAARAEAEAMRRSFVARESEIARLQQELKRMEKQRREAEVAPAPVDPQLQLRRELEARESEARERTQAAIAEAFHGRVDEVPPPLVEALRVAELTYQKALQTELPGAGVAILYSGALERALYLCIVAQLDRHLEIGGRRAELLQASLRDARGPRPEYADRFVGAFDRAHPARAPGLGEVARVLKKRGEPHLAIVRAFLEGERGWSAGFLDALAAFVESSKVKLRDPIAHGRVLEVSDKDIALLRAALLKDFEGGPGIAFRLAFPRG